MNTENQQAEAQHYGNWGKPANPTDWKITGHSSDFDDCGTAQATLQTEGGKLTIEILAGDYESVKTAARVIETAPDLIAASQEALALLDSIAEQFTTNEGGIGAMAKRRAIAIRSALGKGEGKS